MLLLHVLIPMQHLIDEQFPDRRKLYLAGFGTDVFPNWTNPMDVNCRV